METGRMLILTEGKLDVFDAKTAACLLRHCPDRVVGVLDSVHAGARTSGVLGVERDVPVVASVADALQLNPASLVIGASRLRGGRLTGVWRAHVVDAVRAGLNVISGLHQRLGEDPEIASLAREANVEIWDVRKPPAGLPVATARAKQTKAFAHSNDGNRLQCRQDGRHL